MRVLGTIAVTAMLAGSLQAQSKTLTGPLLGFNADAAGSAIRPILGIPGASSLAERLQLEIPLRAIVISPKQDYAIGARAEDEQAVFIDLQADSPVLTGIAGLLPGADLISLSPTGTSAAVYDRGTRSVQIVGHLPQAPQSIHQFDASQTSGVATNIAVNDDGSIALIRFVDGDVATQWVLDAGGGFWSIPAERPSAAAFFPNSADAVVADDATQSSYVVRDLHNAAVRIPLTTAADGITAFAAIGISSDGQRVFLADSASGNIAVVNMTTHRSLLISCECHASGFYRLRGDSIFRLSDASAEPLKVLDASGEDARIVVIPPSVSAIEEAQ